MESWKVSAFILQALGFNNGAARVDFPMAISYDCCELEIVSANIAIPTSLTFISTILCGDPAHKAWIELDASLWVRI